MHAHDARSQVVHVSQLGVVILVICLYCLFGCE